jgi:uncharacterized protein (DUF2164 family)
MAIELSKEARLQAVASIERYFLETSGEKIGNIAAAELLTFFLGEIGPVVYNQAVSQVQERMLARISELDIEVHEDEFQYWRKLDNKKTHK